MKAIVVAIAAMSGQIEELGEDFAHFRARLDQRRHNDFAPIDADAGDDRQALALGPERRCVRHNRDVIEIMRQRWRLGEPFERARAPRISPGRCTGPRTAPHIEEEQPEARGEDERADAGGEVQAIPADVVLISVDAPRHASSRGCASGRTSS